MNNFKKNKLIFLKTLIVIFLNLIFFLLVAIICLVKKNSLTTNTSLKNKPSTNTSSTNIKKTKTENEKDENLELKTTKNNNKEKNENVISSFTTELKTEQEKEKNRIFNIKTAASFLNNLTIKPNSEFSFEKSVWQNKANSYKFADTLTQNGMDKGIGGGICQVATTLYIAALKANLKITQRQPHSKIVSYAPLGLDASFFSTKLKTHKNLKFVNSLKEEIIIKAKLKNNKLKIKILTKKPIKKDYDSILIEDAKIVEKTKKNIKTDVLIKLMQNGKVIKTKHVKSCYKK